MKTPPWPLLHPSAPDRALIPKHPVPVQRDAQARQRNLTTERGSRLSGRQQKDDTADEQRVDAVANLARAKEPEAARLLPQPEERYTKASLAPMADMGIPDATNDSTIAATPDGVTNGSSRSVDKTSATKPSAGKATTNGAEADEADEVDEANDGEECEIKALLTHRMNKDVTVELLVHWAGETEDEATWVLEEEIQKGAAESLYEYWKGQGGRINALFIKPKNPPKEEYHVFDILTHMKKARGGGFDFEVQWVGHPPTRGETSMESEARLKKIAKEKVAEYWKSVGGRNKFLEKRGRGKKARTE
ncbi:hypothetical protein M426DRAFT_123179 [Hypoxylon sp. CI-4A]|nr:hypothetical protein M426DRAFT_123179 [Hypoxylon sp. CI-4A]